jgi:hypothetical protein
MGEEANKLSSNEIPADKDATADEMAAFLGRVGAIDECPICKTDKWIFVGRDHGGVVYLPNPQSTGLMMAVPSYMLICNNCNFIRLHAKKIIDKKLKVISEKVADGK